MHAQQVAEQFIASLAAWTLLYLVFVVAMFVTTTFSAVHCTLNQERDTKLCWVVIIIFLPIAGFLTYWIFHDRSQSSSDRNSKIVPAPPPPDVAANVSAALAVQARQSRRNREGR